MSKRDLEKFLGSAAHDPGCDAGLDVIDEYCEAVLWGDPLSPRFAEFRTHLGNCAACREDTESLLTALRDEAESGAG